MPTIKLQIQGGRATPGPPIGPALAGKGIKSKDVCDQFNALTQGRNEVLRLILNINEEAKTFQLQVKEPPTSLLIKKAAKIEKGSAEPNRNKVATIPQAALAEIAKIKQKELNARDEATAIKILAGTARSMGITVTS